MSLDTSHSIFLWSSLRKNSCLLSISLLRWLLQNLWDCIPTVKHFPFHDHSISSSQKKCWLFKIINLCRWMFIWTNIKANLCSRMYPCSPHMEPQEFLTFASWFIMFDGFKSEDIYCFCSIFNSKDHFAIIQELLMSPIKWLGFCVQIFIFIFKYVQFLAKTYQPVVTLWRISAITTNPNRLWDNTHHNLNQDRFSTSQKNDFHPHLSQNQPTQPSG